MSHESQVLEFQGFQYHARVFRNPRSSLAPIVFVNGAFQTMESWKRLVDEFLPERTVVVTDLPGSGQADLLPAEHGLDFLADSLDHVLTTLHLPPVYLIGASYGSPICYRVAQRHPERVERVAMCGVMKEFPTHRQQALQGCLDSLQKGDLEAFVERVLEGFLNRDPETTILRGRLVQRLLRKQLLAMTPGDQARFIENSVRLQLHTPWDLQPAPCLPALVFTGEHDVFTTPEDCRAVMEAMPSGQLALIRHADHLPHLESFAAVCGLLKAFALDAPLDQLEGVRPCYETTSEAA